MFKISSQDIDAFGQRTLWTPCLKLSKNVLKLRQSPLGSPQCPSQPAPDLSLPHLLPLFPLLTCSSHRDLLAFLPTHQSPPCPRDVAQAVPSAWNPPPPNGARLSPSTPQHVLCPFYLKLSSHHHLISQASLSLHNIYNHLM